MRTVIKESTGQPLHDSGPPYDVVPADRTGLDTLPAGVTHQVTRDTLVDPHSSHLLQAHGTRASGLPQLLLSSKHEGYPRTPDSSEGLIPRATICFMGIDPYVLFF